MEKPSVKCALLAAMIAKHRWGTPIGIDALCTLSAVPRDDYPAARRVAEELRRQPYVTNRGKRGIELNNSRFGELADVLYSECNWDPFEIKTRLKHYEGWKHHEWA